MIEKGSRKTAPPDTARVKVHKYNLQMESKTNTKRQKHTNTHSVRASQKYNKVVTQFLFRKSDFILQLQLTITWLMKDYWITCSIIKSPLISKSK